MPSIVKENTIYEKYKFLRLGLLIKFKGYFLKS